MKTAPLTKSTICLNFFKEKCPILAKHHSCQIKRLQAPWSVNELGDNFIKAYFCIIYMVAKKFENIQKDGPVLEKYSCLNFW